MNTFESTCSMSLPVLQTQRVLSGPRWCPNNPNRPGFHMEFGASLAFVASGANTSSTAATSIAVTVTISSGNVVIVACATVGTAITAPTDNAAGGSNVYMPITARITNTDSIQLWMCVNAKAATTVTMHCTSSRLTCCVATYTGSSTFGNGNSSTGSSSNPSFTTTIGASDSWIVAAFADVGVGAFTAGTGHLRVSDPGAGATTPGVAIVDNTGTAGTSVTTSVTHTSAVWAGVSAELQTAAPLLQREEPPHLDNMISIP